MSAFTHDRLGTPALGRRRRTVRRGALISRAWHAEVARRELTRLGPIAQLRAGRRLRRLSQLAVGLTLYGLTLAMIIRAAVGNAPWDVLHQGIAKHSSLTIGQAVIVMSLVVLVLWIPLKEWPGLGTVANSFLVGLSADLFLRAIATPDHLAVRVLLMAAGVVLNAAATALYIGSQFGPGPRDGLMTGLHRRTGLSIRLVRTALEVSVVGIGFALGGLVGLGTVVYTLAIGPLVQLMLPYAIVDLGQPAASGTRPVLPRRCVPAEPLTASSGCLSSS